MVYEKEILVSCHFLNAHRIDGRWIVSPTSLPKVFAFDEGRGEARESRFPSGDSPDTTIPLNTNSLRSTNLKNLHESGPALKVYLSPNVCYTRILKTFTPKSTGYLEPGHFWAIPIENLKFGCGVVISLRLKEDGKPDSRSFLAGLIDWIGNSEPKAEDIAGKEIVAVRFAHIKTITLSGGEIIGYVDPWWDWPTSIKNDDAIPTAGYNVLPILAKQLAETAAKNTDQR